ncbi:MAG: hypothetical protein ACI4A5_03285 [Hominilimicola sp.]
MSCCIGFKTNDGLIIAVDGRSSFTYEGIKYRTGENTQKFIIHNDELVVTFGNADVIEIFKKNCADFPDKSLNDLFDMSLTQKRIDEYLKDDLQQETLLLVVYKFNISKNKINEIYFDANGKGNLSAPLYDYFCFGFNSGKINDYISKDIIGKFNNVYEILQILFDKFNFAEIGGCWTIFNITDKAIIQGTYHSSMDNIPAASDWLIEQIKRNVHEHIEKYRCCQVQSPKIVGNFVLGSEISGGSFWDDSKISCLKLSSTDNKFADLTFSKYNGDELFKIYDGIDYVSMYLKGINIGHAGHGEFNADGVWNFSGATVKGIKATFG